MTTDISRLDVPQSVVEAEAERLWAERDRRVGALRFRQAAGRTTDPKEQLVYRLDAKLIRHPELLATEADYPEWAAEFAAKQAAERRTRKAAS